MRLDPRRRPNLALIGAALVLAGSAAVVTRPSYANTLPFVPAAPRATAFDRSAEIRWTGPGPESAAVDSYRITWVQAGRVSVVPSTPLVATIRDIPNGQAATFTVSAHTAAGWGQASPASTPVYPTRPNIVVIVSDDQRADSLGYMPLTNNRSWRRYSRAFVPEPQCCPSRASLLTGRLPSTTGVDTLTRGGRLDESTTLATMLDAVGYRTMLFGKYLNDYPFGRPPYDPAGWDTFRAFTGSYGYYGYTLSGAGGSETFGHAPADYATDELGTLAIEGLRATPPATPAFLYLAPNAPHLPYVEAPRHTGSCSGITLANPPSFNAVDTGGEPTWMAAESPVPPLVNNVARRLTCSLLKTLDETTNAVLNELQRLRRLANTYVVFTSDNGWHFGEHRLLSKGDLYEEAIRVPLLIRGPGVTPGTSTRLTSNIDLAPSIVQWARTAAPPGFFDGKSLATEARGLTASQPSAVLLRGCRTTATATGGAGPCGGYRSAFMNWGVRTARWKYIVYTDGYEQLFDLASDPYEMTNLALAPASAPTLAALRAELIALGGGGPPTIP